MRLIEHVRSQWMGALALFLVIAGGTAYAANTIGSSDIVNGQVKSPDIGTGQVQSVDVRDDTLSNGGLGSADIADGALNDEDIAKTRFVSFSGDIGEVGANECVDRPVSGINVAPGDISCSRLSGTYPTRRPICPIRRLTLSSTPSRRTPCSFASATPRRLS